jgi:deazaflavin-dependent oxidoreductase (nitroreductase family)
MAITPVAPQRLPQNAPNRPLFGLRNKPGRVALALMRMPLRAYAHGQGHLLGHTFLEFTHIGRKTGMLRKSVAMVLDYDAVTGDAVIAAAWGPDTDWYRNLKVHPATEVTLGRLSFAPQQRILAEDEAFQVALKFRRAHPHRLRLISRILGWGDLRNDNKLREFVGDRPFIAFRPDAAG